MGKLKIAITFCLFIVAILHCSAFANSADEGLTDFRLIPMSDLPAQSCHDGAIDHSQWTKFDFPSLTAKQYVCIRAKLLVSETNHINSPAILFLALASYDIYLNGLLLGTNGKPGTSAEFEQVGAISSLLPLNTSALTPGEHLLSIELSSFNLTRSFAAIAYELALVDQQNFYDIVIQLSAITALLIGALVVIFVIFLALYWRFNRASNLLIFSLLCFATAALLVAEQWKIFVNYQYDLHLLRLQLIIAMTILVNGLLLAYYLVQQTAKRKLYWFAAWTLAQVIVILVAQSYDERSILLFSTSLVFVVVINLIAVVQKKAAGMTALLISAVSLLALLLAPRLFVELGFGLCIIVVLISIGIALLNELVRQRNLALESAKLKGELLRRNLQPHYLMNCLMQVQELIDVAPKQANSFVEQLAQEFRGLVVMSDKELVPLEQELQLCRSHLAIMSVRYQREYQLRVTYTGNVKSHSELYVPAAIIHSQIENCFSHNRITSDQSIELKVGCEDNKITLELITPIDVNLEHQGVGVGEAYIRAKMAQSCQSGWLLQSEASANQWTTKYQYEPINILINKDSGSNL